MLEVALDAKETEVLVGQGNHTVRSEYQNLLLSIAQILALSIENLRLYNVVKEQSEVDQLTGVFNRRMFDRRLADEVKRARRYSRDLALLMIDLDPQMNLTTKILNDEAKFEQYFTGLQPNFPALKKPGS